MKKIIGISGKSLSGKDTVAKLIIEKYPQYEIQKFATPLRQVVSILTGICVSDLEKEEIKRSILPTCWNINGNPITVRELMILIGTNLIRNQLHEDAWVNALFSLYTKKCVIKRECLQMLPIIEEEFPYWIITDVRFPNEIKRIKDHGGIVIRVSRPLHLRYPHIYQEAMQHGFNQDSLLQYIVEKYPTLYQVLTHESETMLDSYSSFDCEIQNHGSTEDLKNEIEKYIIPLL